MEYETNTNPNDRKDREREPLTGHLECQRTVGSLARGSRDPAQYERHKCRDERQWERLNARELVVEKTVCPVVRTSRNRNRDQARDDDREHDDTCESERGARLGLRFFT